MPIEKIEASLHKQQLHNATVKQNIEQIEALAQHVYLDELIQKLKDWQGSGSLKVSNTLFWCILLSAFLVLAVIFIVHLPLYLLFITVALVIFAFYKKESLQARNHLVKSLRLQRLQQKYRLQFGAVFQQYDLQALELNFPLFALGNYSNSIEDTATGQIKLASKIYPFMLYRYHYVDQSSKRDKDGNVSYQYHHYDRWGIFVDDFPVQGISISTKQKRACRLGIKWSTSDIQFNKCYEMSGVNEMALARFFNPSRILVLEKVMQAFKGDFYIHPQIPLLCWQFATDVFQFSPQHSDIVNTKQLAELIESLEMPALQNLQEQLAHLLEKLE